MAGALPVAPPTGAGPNEAANRQLVQQMAVQGAAAKMQAPSIATAPEAMQTAMARSAGVNAPSQFNATQVATIANPYARADSQLAADQAGVGGVLGAVSSSTANYEAQARAAAPLQQEITRRAVQKMLSDQKNDARKASLDERRMALEEKALALEEDPNSPENQLKQRKIKQELADMNKPTGPASSKDIEMRTGIPAATQTAYESNPWYKANVSAIFQAAEEQNLSFDQFSAVVAGEVAEAATVAENQIDKSAVADLTRMITQQYGQMLPGYVASGMGAGTPPTAAAAAALPGTSYKTGTGPKQDYIPQQSMMFGRSVPGTGQTVNAPTPGQIAVQRGAAPAAPAPTVLPEGAIPMSPEMLAMSAEMAKKFPPGTFDTPVVMSDADKKKLETKTKAKPKGKSKAK